MSRLVALFLLTALFFFAQASEHREKRGAPITFNPQWPNPVPYRIDDNFNEDQKAIIKTGIKSIMDNTCIDFADNTNDQYKLRYTFTPASTCKSGLGDTRLLWDADHDVILSAGCVILGRVQHETAHALGIDHTQCRPDRDNFLIVDESNIRVNFTKNFEKNSPEDTPNFGIPFEYGSRMMYPPYDYNIRKEPVMTPRDATYMASMGTGPVLTFYDWKIINSLYNCTGKYSVSCPTTKVTCLNGGYQHPRDCSRCMCGDFFDGPTCEIERGVITIQSGGEQVLTFNKTGDMAFDNMTRYDWANLQPEIHVIKAPKNSRIRVTFNKLSAEKPQSGNRAMSQCPRTVPVCDNFGVEIADEDLNFGGRKFCCDLTSYLSKSNVIGYRAYTLRGTTFESQVTFSVEPGADQPTTTTTKPTVTTTTTVPTTTTKPTVPTTSTVPTTTTKAPVTTTTTVPTTTTTIKPTVPTTTTAPTTTTKPDPTTTSVPTTTTAPTVTTTVPARPPQPIPPKPTFSSNNCANWNVYTFDASRGRCLASVTQICTEQDWTNAQTKTYQACKTASPIPSPAVEECNCNMQYRQCQRVPGEPVDILYGPPTGPSICNGENVPYVFGQTKPAKRQCCVPADKA